MVSYSPCVAVMFTERAFTYTIELLRGTQRVFAKIFVKKNKNTEKRRPAKAKRLFG